jgi:hypothetical protein
MPSRSRMAALALIAGSLALETGSIARGADEPVVANTVRLQLQITGLSSKGCVLKVAPAHPGCKFKAIERRIDSGNADGMIRLKEPIVLQATSTAADRDCSFAITIQEPGLPPQTYRRGLRLVPGVAGQPAPIQTLKVYLSAPSIAARDAAGKARR